MTSLKQFIEILHLCIFYTFRGDQGKITEKSYLITFVGHLDHVVTIGGGVLEEIFKKMVGILNFFRGFQSYVDTNIIWIKLFSRCRELRGLNLAGPDTVEKFHLFYRWEFDVWRERWAGWRQATRIQMTPSWALDSNSEPILF